MSKIAGWILVITIILTFVLSGYYIFSILSHPILYQEEIVEIAKTYNLSPSTLASLINVESSYRDDSRSNKNAIGLTQIKLTTANYLNELEGRNLIDEDSLYDPHINIEYGAKYLRYLMNKFSDPNTALASYNAGETRVRSWLKNKTYSLDGKTLRYIPFEETRNYIKKINQNIKFYSKIYN